MDLSTVSGPQIVKSQDGKTATKYFVRKEKIDLDKLRKEKEVLEAQLAEKEPTKAELLELGKQNHPYYTSRDFASERIEEIDKILGE